MTLNAPLPARPGQPEVDGPYEGVPSWLQQPLRRWLEKHIRDVKDKDGLQKRHMLIAGRLRIDLADEDRNNAPFYKIMGYAQESDDQYLNVVHRTLDVLRARDFVPRGLKPHEELDQQLTYASSVWRATEDHGLVRRVDPTAQAAFEMATTPEDIASDELKEAWVKAYGFEPDASDAWGHAIGAVEEILVPIVISKQDDPHIGQVLGQLDRHPELYDFGLRFNQTKPPAIPPTTPLQALVGMLRLIYPNPDRHKGSSHRVPTLEEARDIVHLAVAVVQLARDRQIRKR